MNSDKENSVDAAVVFGVVGDLGVFAPDDLAAGGDETELADVDLNDRTLGNDTKLRVEGRARILLHSDNGELERGLQLRVLRENTNVREREEKRAQSEIWGLDRRR